MFQRLERTGYPPEEKPLMVWDGNCGFCHYWIIRWRKTTGTRIDYQKYQVVAGNMPDIPVSRFKEAVRLIEPDGRIFNGPEGAYRTLSYGKKWPWKMMLALYGRSAFFKWISDAGYEYIARHRELMFGLTRTMFGRDPRNTRLYWLGYLLLIVLAAVIFLRLV